MLNTKSSNTNGYKAKKYPHNVEMSELWEKIKVSRKCVKITQEELGANCEPPVSRAAVAQWESKNPENRTAPKHDNLLSIHKITGAPIEWLIDDSRDINEDWQLVADRDDDDDYIDGEVVRHELPGPDISSLMADSSPRPPVIGENEWKALPLKTRTLVEDLMKKSSDGILKEEYVKMLQNMVDVFSKE